MGRKNIVLIVMAGILGVLFIGSAVLLFRGIGRFNASEENLEKEQEKLDKFYEKDPFPSEANVEKERQNVETVRQWFRRIMAELRQGQITPDASKSPSLFILTLQRKKEEMEALFPETENLRFGFEQYLVEDMVSPLPADVPRLTQQLLITEQLAKVLNTAGVRKLERIERELFEGVEEAPERRGGGRSTARRRSVRRGRSGELANADAGEIPPGALYGKYHFLLEFEAREDSVLETLDRFSGHDLFIVMTWLSFERESRDVRTLEQAQHAVSEAEKKRLSEGDDLPRAERLMSGPSLEEPMMVRMEVDVYNFAETVSNED